MISKARKWTSQQENRFLNTTAVALAACEHALELYKGDGTPLISNPRGDLPSAIIDNLDVMDGLMMHMANEGDKRAAASCKVYGEHVVSRMEWGVLRTDRWQLSRVLKDRRAAARQDQQAMILSFTSLGYTARLLC